MNRLGKLAGLALGLLLLVLFLRKSGLDELGQSLRAAHLGHVLLAVLAAVVSFVFRALRWRTLLMPVKATRFGNVFGITMVAYMVSNLVPGRLGDFVVRPFLIGRSEGLSKTAAFATIVVERIFDLLIVLVLFAVYVAFGPPPARAAIDLGPARTAGGALLAACLLAVAGLILLRAKGSMARAWVERAARRLPERFRPRFTSMAGAFLEGLGLFKDPWNAAASVLYGFLTWLGIAVSMYWGARAFGLDQVTLIGTFLMIGLGAVGVAVPVPAGLGAFHFLVYEALRMLGCPEGPLSQSAVLVIHAACVVPVSLLGFYYWLRYGVFHVKLAEVAEAEAAEGGP